MNNVPRQSHEAYLRIIKVLSPVQPYSLPKTQDRLTEITGINLVDYHCCINSCMAFTDIAHRDLDTCLVCNEARLDSNGNPRKIFGYIPLIHCLRVQYGNAFRAQTLSEYPASLRSSQGDKPFDAVDNKIRDIWDGKQIRELRAKKGFFMDNTDIAFGFSSDGFTVFAGRGKNFQSWPLLLINYNLPPTQRYRKRNVILLGHIPGPSQKKIDIDSFLRPFINEMKLLQVGVSDTWNAFTEEKFTLRAHLITISADTKARALLAGTTGCNSYRYCPYCCAFAIWNKHCYCPFSLPRPETVPAEQRSKVFQSGFKPLNIQTLPCHSNVDRRRIGFNALMDSNWKHSAKTQGITRFTIFSELHSVNLYSAFVLDMMHLGWENLIPMMMEHWMGKFFDKSSLDNRNASKFKETDDEYNVPIHAWQSMVEDLRKSKQTIPTEIIREGVRPIDTCSTFKAIEWQYWATVVSPLMMKGVLPDDYYIGYMHLVSALTTAINTTITRKQLEDLRHEITIFLTHYEDKYYQRDYARLSTCTSQIHYLAHLADCIEAYGPAWVYWQYAMERVCGAIGHSVKSKVQTNRHIALTTLRMEQLNNLRFRSILDPEDDRRIPLNDDSDSEDDQDGDSGIMRMFLSRMRKHGPQTRPTPEEKTDTVGENTLINQKHRTPLTTVERRHIKDWYGNILGVEIEIGNVPLRATTWTKVRLSNGLHVTPHEHIKKNCTRTPSLIRSEIEQGDSTCSIFGRLLRVITIDVDLPDNLDLQDSYDLGIIQRFIVGSDDGNFVHIQSIGPKYCIEMNNIKELVGLVYKNDVAYIVGKYTSIMA